MTVTQTATVKRVKTTEDMISGLRRQVRGLEAKAVDEDPWAIKDMLDIAKELEAAAVRVVAAKRSQGLRWEDIGFSLGITGLTAHKRYAAKVAEINAAAK